MNLSDEEATLNGMTSKSFQRLIDTRNRLLNSFFYLKIEHTKWKLEARAESKTIQ